MLSIYGTVIAVIISYLRAPKSLEISKQKDLYGTKFI